MTWSAQSNLTGYTVQFRVAGSSIWTTVPAPAPAPAANATSATITGLAANTSYEFRLTATNADGASSSVLAAATTVAPPAPVANPVRPNVSNNSQLTTANSLTLNFTAPSGQSIAGNTAYNITMTTGSGNNATTITLVEGQNFVYVYTNGVISGIQVIGLNANTQYTFNITAVNANGTTSAAASVNNVKTANR